MELRMKMVRVEYILGLLEDLASKMGILEVFFFVLTYLLRDEYGGLGLRRENEGCGWN